MKKMKLLVLCMFVITVTTQSQSKKEQDKNAIKKMCGCYEVSFNFAETFQYSKDENYKASDKKHSKGLEWVELVQEDKNKLVLQHLLIVGKDDKKSIVKHWRQDWLYENTELYVYEANNKWKFQEIPKNDVKGQWTQKVFQVDDSPRYEGSATWIHVDGKSFWENTTDAPLPRREYTVRNDYNVTVRTNKHEITDFGWIHDQDNDKVLRENGKDELLAQEKGLNTYTKVDDSKCKVAQDWWKNNQENWKIVRAKWDNIFDRKSDLHLKRTWNEKPLFSHLFSKDFSFDDSNVNTLINAFVQE